MDELTKDKEKSFLNKLNKYIENDIKEIKKRPLKNIWELIKGFIIYFIISIIILFFITRPIHCYTKNSKILQIEEYKFNYNNIEKCEVTYIKEIKNTYKAMTTKIIIQNEEDKNWTKQIRINP